METPSLLDIDVHKKNTYANTYLNTAEKQATVGKQAHSHLPSG